MDYRCPVCAKDLGKRRLSQSIVAKMSIECKHCNSVIFLNVHRVESIVVMLNFLVIIALALSAYWLHNGNLVLLALFAAMAGAAAQPLLERTFLRDWPRYVSADRNAGNQPPRAVP